MTLERERRGRVEILLLRHQLAGMHHEIAQHGKRLGGEQQALVVCRLPVAPETLVDGIQPEWLELLHAPLHCGDGWCRGPGRRCAALVVLRIPLSHGAGYHKTTFGRF